MGRMAQALNPKRDKDTTPVRVKICGLTDAGGIAAALHGGADFLGFVMFEKSPRHVTPHGAFELAKAARGRAQIVAVTVDAEDAVLAEIVTILKPDYVQAHGQESPARVAEIKARFGVKVIRAVRVDDTPLSQVAQAYSGAADLMLYDAAPPPGAAIPGGNGLQFDWRLTEPLSSDPPWFLAGGLTPANVREALAVSGAPMVDVSSGVEAAPGCKDPSLISAFLRAARSPSSV